MHNFTPVCWCSVSFRVSQQSLAWGCEPQCTAILEKIRTCNLSQCKCMLDVHFSDWVGSSNVFLSDSVDFVTILQILWWQETRIMLKIHKKSLLGMWKMTKCICFFLQKIYHTDNHLNNYSQAHGWSYNATRPWSPMPTPKILALRLLNSLITT